MKQSSFSIYSCLLCILIIQIISTDIAKSADLHVILHNPEDVTLIYLTGEIIEGDAYKFRELPGDIRKAIILLESPGGLVKDALDIGATIRLNGWSTSVPPGKECYSSCALIWIAGSNRYMSRSSVIGFHAAYKTSELGNLESGIGNAEVGSYLTHLGLSIEAIRFATIAGPNDLSILTPEIAQAIGIDVILEDNGAIVDPRQRPSGADLAYGFVLVSAWKASCSQILGPVNGAMSALQEQSFQEGNRLLGSELWVDYQFQALEDIKLLFVESGLLSACLFLDEWLQSREVRTPVSGPGFDCSAAKTETEIAICTDKTLWADDLIMNDIYLGYRDSERNEARAQYFAEQRAWLSLRDSCGHDLQCLRDVYAARLRILAARLGL